VLTKCGPHIWLCWNTTVTFSWLGVIEVTHQTAVPKVQSSILGSENDFYGGLFVLMIMIRVSGYRHLRKLPTPPCSSLNSGVIRRSRVIKFHYRPFSSNHVTNK